MDSSKLYIYNTLSREKEAFEAIRPPHVGLYVCGPTVYGEAHLGHARPYVTFDVLYRYLQHLGYKVRYVRNITDVGHLENDADEGEDKIAKKARLEQLEPMEVVELYTGSFHESMRMLNTLNPGIEPRASGHIPEQIEMILAIIDNGFAYESNGSVYFDVIKYSKTNDYGKLSGRVLEDLIAGAGNERRVLEGQDEKRNPEDFALWKKADAYHIMRWNSPWGIGFPGWHIECSAMSKKYLGETFDIHGGGMDLQFPHHENEIAQNIGACGCQPVNYWMHGNMLILNGKKMSKSDGNYIMPRELFSGSSPLMSKAYSPMTLRFFMLQAHYRSTLNITEDAMLAAEKGLQRIMETNSILQALQYNSNENIAELDSKINNIINAVFDEMDNDFNTPNALAELFGLATEIQKFQNNQQPLSLISESTLKRLKETFNIVLFDIFGLKDEAAENEGSPELLDGLMDMIIDFRKEVREQKNWAKSDLIRDKLLELGVQIKDGKEGASWNKV